MKNFNFQQGKAKRLFISCALLLALLAVNTDHALSQTSAIEPHILPPDVWSFMKYGNVPVDMYTGAANVSIPIYTYKDNDFEIPISLDYVSSGFIPNIPAGSVGVGWFLNAGGMITREVNGIPDEYSHPYNIYEGQFTYRPYKHYTPFNLQGYYSYYLAWKINNTPTYLSRFYPRWLALDDVCCDVIYYPIEVSNNMVINAAEASADVFSFNFMGHRGKFHMSRSEVVVYETTDPKGEYHVDLSGFGDQQSTIKITTGDGYIYTFGGLDDRSNDDLEARSWYCPYMPHGSEPGDIEADEIMETPGVYSQWQLISIEAPNGRQVNFGYSEHKTIETIRPESRVQHISGYKKVDGTGKILDDKQYKSGVVKHVAKTRQLTSVSTENCDIKFTYNQSSTYEIGVNIHKDYIQLRGGCTDNHNSDGEPEYTTTTKSPGRLNSIVIMDRIRNQAVKTINLSYITLGTGVQKKLFLTEVNIPGLGKYQMSYIDGNFPINGTPSVDYWGFYNSECYDTNCTIHGKLVGNVAVGTTYQTFQDTELQRRYPNFNFSKLGMLETIAYPTGGYSKFEYEPHYASTFVKRSVSSNSGYPVLANYSIKNYSGIFTQEVGGVRVKSITSSGYNSSGSDDQIIGEEVEEKISEPAAEVWEYPRRMITKEYYYENTDNFSSGNVLYFPIYRSYYIMNVAHDRVESRLTKQTISPLNLHVFSQDKSHIEYGRVIEKYADGSYKEYNFTTYASYPDIMPRYIAELTDYNDGAQYIAPEYMENFMRKPISKSFHRGKLKSVVSYNSDSVPVAATHYNYDTEESLSYTKEVMHSGAECYEYLRYTDVYKLESLIETQYFPSSTTGTNAVTQTTSYSYNDKGQTSSVIKKYPNGVSETTDIRYLHNGSISAKELSMLNRKMLKYPDVVSKTITEPNSSPILVDAVDYSYENGKVIGISKALTPTLNSTYYCDYYGLVDYSYDESGRLREKSDANGLKTTYIWGYKGMYPIAVIENSPGFHEIKAPFTDTVSGEVIISFEGLSQNQEEYLRNIPGAKVTTYKYKPLIGMTESVDPSGRKTIYEYNSGGNLQYIKDENGYILKQYDYSIE